MNGSRGPRRDVNIPVWALVTAAVVLVLNVSGVAAAGVLGNLATAKSVTETLPPSYSAPAVEPEVTITPSEEPASELNAGPDSNSTTTAPVDQPAPVVVEQPALAAPTKPAVVCPVGRLSGGVLGATVGPGPISTMPRITVTAYVRNNSDTRVILFRNGTPDVRGYDATGGVSIIELSGTWANTARDSFAIQPGETLNYVTAWTVTQQQLDSVVALYASPDIGSLVAAWPTTEQLALCPSPLPNAGSGTDFPY